MPYDLFFVIVADDGEASVAGDDLAVGVGFVDVVVTGRLYLCTRVCEVR